ncbi:MAG: glycosyltransferase, partial [Flavobacteriales bacterium]
DMFDGARILVAPLDWGLGHAARCVPIIKALITHGAVPVIGADKGPLALLSEEFPTLEHARIPGIEVRYTKGRSQAWAMAKQFPAMLRSVSEEQQLFDRLRRDLQLDAVISDQRFGIRANDVPSVLITHQLFPFTPLLQGPLRRMNLRKVERFHRCWIPDVPEVPGLAGELSHGHHVPSNVHYIGPVSRFRDGDVRASSERYRVVAVISGPEPQRALFEQKVITQLRIINGRHLVVSGTPGKQKERQDGNIRIVPHLKGEALRSSLLGAELIVGRSGYTTLMDLNALGRSALLVPTPGQGEQDYLGRLHSTIGDHIIQQQHELDFAKVMVKPLGDRIPLNNRELLLQALGDLKTLIQVR